MKYWWLVNLAVAVLCGVTAVDCILHHRFFLMALNVNLALLNIAAAAYFITRERDNGSQ